jgi:hypothetical protein
MPAHAQRLGPVRDGQVDRRAADSLAAVGASKLANQTSVHSDAFSQLQRRPGALISLFLAAEVRAAIA